MFTAAYEGDVQAVVTWLDGGGGVDASQQISVEGTLVTTNGATLLVAATMGEQEAMVRMLLQRGASVNLQNPFGSTALMAAAAHYHNVTVKRFLQVDHK